MTDKEQIIIDGINVKKCKHFCLEPQIPDMALAGFSKICGEEYIAKECEDNPDCCFKQLARKTQECEQKDERIIELTKEALSLKQECEELKERNKKIEDDWTSTANRNLDIEMENAKLQEKVKAYEKLALHITCPHCNKELGLILNGSEENINLFNRYRKALEEIEEFVLKVDGADECSYGDFNCSNCDDDCTCPTKVKRLILDIINKAKGEE